MKKILIGFSNNINDNLNKIKIWSKSFNKYCKYSDVYLIAANASDKEINQLKNLNIRVYNIDIPKEDLIYINHKRLLYTYNLISSIVADIILITDVFDVVFQNDPFLKLDLTNYDLFLTLEGVRVSQEPWNADVINKLFPDYIKLCLNKEVICSGIICGKKDHISRLINNMYLACENANNNHNIKDQAALIVLDCTRQIESRIKYFNLNDAWVVNCAVAGPTDFFESWGFKNCLINNKYHIPVLDNHLIKTNNNIYDIVHQFNRIPVWYKELIKQYE